MPETERVWLVFREYTDKGLLNLVYATPDGEHVLRKQRSLNAGDPTAAVDADADDLEPVEDAEDRQRYGQEASRMRDSHDPDDRV
ncbi:uncharacterized protein HHUB_3748 [Halobacterium hubeiense]|jgi:hypothetical protein|uniref:DUF7967 domain-containing protein n=2 Tax=Halobacterium TaxID=2239 RepID=A0A0U5H3Y2_9EURY|nr:hypothetical protein [Halobacterium hubeiense]CQH62407.1 uncharacterized protein HHUB_3748 [Halobacterium hubeiense]